MANALEAARVSPASLPVIDISGLSSASAADRRAVGAQLRAACLDKGFFYIKNHGVPEGLVDSVFKEAAAFFALPAAQKAEVDKAHSKANRGYEPLQGQTVGVTLYGEPNPVLEQFLIAAGAQVRTVMPYIYAPAADDAPRRTAVDRDEPPSRSRACCSTCRRRSPRT